MHKFNKITTFLIFFVFANNLFSQTQNIISSKDIKTNITFLASDSLKGRFPGTPENKIAAEFIKNKFKTAGLKSFYNDYFQYFNVTTNIILGKKNKLIFNDTTYILNKDYIPLSFSTNSNFKSNIAFVGYGFDINTDSLKWNDYKNIDVKNKWAMILIADPDMDNLNSRFIHYEGERTKALLAKEKGAKGVIFVQGYDFDKSDKLMTSFYDKSVLHVGIPVVNISKKLAEKILKTQGKTLKNVEKNIIKTKQPNSFLINQQIDITTDILPKVVKTQNVVAYIKSNNKQFKDEYIVIGAHYDHLGFGGKNTASRMPDTIAIHNGADDNASGVASIIELAKQFAKDKNKLKRSIIFVSFSGEEMGLLGSDYFVKHLPVKKEQIKAMINIDMLGRFNKDTKKLEIGGTGTAKQIPDIINSINHNGFKLSLSTDGYGPSDHASFYSAGYPVLYFSTGAHEDYHTPFDKVNKIDFKSQKMLLDYIYNVSLKIINLDKNLVFKHSDSEHMSRHGRRFKITFGIIPDYSSDKNDGLLVNGIKKNGPADKAGMLKGDKIIAINGEKVTNIYDYMYRLMKLEKGKIALVEVIRNNKKQVLLIHL